MTTEERRIRFLVDQYIHHYFGYKLYKETKRHLEDIVEEEFESQHQPTLLLEPVLLRGTNRDLLITKRCDKQIQIRIKDRPLL